MIKKFVGPFILFGLSIAIVFGWVAPRYQNLTDLQSQIKGKQTELGYLEEKINNLAAVSSELKKHQEGIAKINYAIPSDPSLPYYYDLLQSMVSQNGLILKNISNFSVKNTPDSKLKEIKVGLEVEGSYVSFKNFISTIGSSARLIEVESISFKSPTEKKDYFTFGLSLSAHSY